MPLPLSAGVVGQGLPPTISSKTFAAFGSPPDELTFCARAALSLNAPGWIFAQLAAWIGPPAGALVGQVCVNALTEPAAGGFPCFFR